MKFQTNTTIYRKNIIDDLIKHIKNCIKLVKLINARPHGFPNNPFWKVVFTKM